MDWIGWNLGIVCPCDNTTKWLGVSIQSLARHTTENVRNCRRSLRLRLSGPEDPFRPENKRLITLIKSWTRESLQRSPLASCFTRKCISPTSSAIAAMCRERISKRNGRWHCKDAYFLWLRLWLHYLRLRIEGSHSWYKRWKHVSGNWPF